MRYLMLIYQGSTPTPGSEEWERLPQEEKEAVYAAYREVNETPGMTPGEQMQPPEQATTVRVQDGRTLATDGPFVEVKEAVGGYFFFDADSAESAVELASRIPAARMGGGVELRPLVQRR